MASDPLLRLRVVFVLALLVSGIPNPNSRVGLGLGSWEEEGSDLGEAFSILSYHDYSPPVPPPPAAPEPTSSSCEADLGGAGDFDTLCEVLSSVRLNGSVFFRGNGSLVLRTGAVLSCPLAGCSIKGSLSGELRIEQNAGILAGRVFMAVANMSLAEGTALNTTGLAGDPPAQTSGTPPGTNGDGGGHGGRGASCVVKEGQSPEDSWGGDAYSWSSLMKPDSYGSKGGTTSRETDYGGGGGGRVWLEVEDTLLLDGIISADGGDGGPKGGGGSGGSIYIKASKM